MLDNVLTICERDHASMHFRQFHVQFVATDHLPWVVAEDLHTYDSDGYERVYGGKKLAAFGRLCEAGEFLERVVDKARLNAPFVSATFRKM